MVQPSLYVPGEEETDLRRVIQSLQLVTSKVWPYTGGNMVSAGGYSSLQAALSALPATGGTVVVPAGYSETLAADLTIANPGGFIFLGSATITMGTFGIIIPSGVNGAFIKGMNTCSDTHAMPYQGSVKFVYTGSGSAITIGSDISIRTAFTTIENISIDLTGAANSAGGIRATNVQFYLFSRVTVLGTGSPTTDYRGIVLVGGTGGDDFVGYGRIMDPLLDGMTYGVLTTQQVNDNTMIGGLIDSGTTGTYGVYRTGSCGGFMVLNTEIASLATGIFLDTGIINDYYLFYGEGNTVDIQAAAGSVGNFANKIIGPLAGVSDSGTRNVFTSVPDAKVSVGTVSTLGTCDAAHEGTIKGVTDATATAYGPVVGGGGFHVSVYCDGTNWVTGA